jgi:galactose-1-phosphate uridylyltransferase
MDKPSVEPQLTMRFSLQEMRQSEAKEWISRYQQKIKELGKAKASAWWQTTIADISKRRGESAADDLRKRMNEIRSQG